MSAEARLTELEIELPDPFPPVGPAGERRTVVPDQVPWLASAASSSKATMLVILIIGFTAGPAVSL